MRFYNDVTGEIVDYPEAAAKLFPALKPVPSEKAKANAVEVEIDGETKPTAAKNTNPKDGK